jgi:hypothetical protein
LRLFQRSFELLAELERVIVAAVEELKAVTG